MTANPPSKKKNILVAPEYAMANLAETHRMASIANALLELGHEVTVLGNGRYDYLFESQDFHRVDIPYDQEFMTDEKYFEFHNIDQNGFDFFTEYELNRLVREEVALLEKMMPDVVINGFRPSMAISTKAVDVPYVCVMSAVLSDLYEECGLKTIPYGFQRPGKMMVQIARVVNSKFFTKLVKRRVLVQKWYRVWNQVIKQYDMPPFQTITGCVKGDFNLMPDAPELFPEMSDLPPYYAFSGPLLYESSIETPACLLNYKKTGKPVVVLNMGSSGDPDTFSRLIYGFENKNYDVFCAASSIVDRQTLGSVPDNVFIEEMFPLFKLAEIADVALIHGGHGTLYSTIMGGTPFIGIPMFCENQWNLENAARKGCGIVIPKHKLDLKTVFNAIDEILNNDSYRNNVAAVKKSLEKYMHDQEHRPARVAATKIIDYLENTSRSKSYFSTNKY